MNELKKYPLIILFSVFILGLSFLDVVTPIRDFSDVENRVLAKRPEFTVEELLNNNYTSKYETYVNDQFIGRDMWITTKSVGEQGLAKIINNNIVYGKDGYLFDLTLATDADRLERNIRYLNEFLQMYADENVFVTLIPNSTTILKNKLPIGFPGLDQNVLYDLISKDIKQEQLIDLFSILLAQQDEYIYYKTDHHWTTQGAYYAYEALGEKLNYEPKSLDEFEAIEVEDFYGTYYSRVKNPLVESDTLTYYNIENVEMTILDKTYNTLYDTKQFETYDKYSGYLNGNNGFTRIETNIKNDRKILILKDSYTNSLAPFLTQHFETIDLIDLRHTNISLQQVIESENYDEILFMFSIGNFMTEANIAKLRY